MNETELKAKSAKAIDFVRETADKYSATVNQKISEIWFYEYRVWIKDSNDLCEIRIQKIIGGLVHLVINQKSYLLNYDGVERISKWLFEGVGPTLRLNGNESETVSRELITPMKKDFWDSWKTNPSWSNVYIQVLYPLVKKYMYHLLGKESSSILEVCGGDGELAGGILNEMGDKVKEYVLLDNNKVSIEKAQNTLQPFIKSKKVELILCDVTEGNLTTRVNRTFKIVLGIGALTQAVLEKKSALKVFDELVDMIESDGYLVLTGITEQWVDSETMIQKGLSIKNRSLPNDQLQFYVAQKKK